MDSYTDTEAESRKEFLLFPISNNTTGCAIIVDREPRPLSIHPLPLSVSMAGVEQDSSARPSLPEQRFPLAKSPLS